MYVGAMEKEDAVKLANSLSLMPLQAQSKRPLRGQKWDKYMRERATPDEVRGWLESGYSLGCVCGAVSGGLLVIDFDQQTAWQPWINACGEALGNHDFWRHFPVVKTQKGTHLYLRCDKAPGNEVLSRDADNRIIIETRGEGGYVVFPHGHDKYELVNGDLESIPLVDSKNLDLLLGTARSFNETANMAFVDQEHVGEGKPGDDFNNRTTWEELLSSHGWKYVRTRPDGVSEWTRPGKDFGVSATTGIHGSDLLYVFTSSAFPLEAGKSYTKFACFAYLEHGGDFGEAARDLAGRGFGAALASGSKNVTEHLYDLGGGVEWYRDGNSDVYIRVPGSSGAHQIVAGECPEYAFYVEKRFRDKMGGFPSEKALKEALVKLERHSEKTDIPDIPLRVHHVDETTYIDTGLEEAIIITPGKVRIEKPPVDVFFKRPQGLVGLDAPDVNGSLDSFQSLINYKSESDWHLILSWITSCIGMGADATFPILTIAGEAGAAKTTGTKLMRMLIDPAFPPLLPNPRTTDALYFQSVFNYVMAYDNLSGISNDVSDALCTLVSGTGFVARKLYTNLGRVALTVKRPVCLNGIDNVARRNDFASRTLFVTFAKLLEGERLRDKEVAALMQKDLDKWRGSCYNIVSEVKKVDRSKLERSNFRLADFTEWSLALADVMGWNQKDIISSLRENEAELLSCIRESDLVAVYTEAFMERRVVWEGSTRELYEALVSIVPPDVKKSKDWPDTLNGFGMRLNRAAPTLDVAGIAVEKVRSNGVRKLRITKEDNDG